MFNLFFHGVFVLVLLFLSLDVNFVELEFVTLLKSALSFTFDFFQFFNRELRFTWLVKRYDQSIQGTTSIGCYSVTKDNIAYGNGAFGYW